MIAASQEILAPRSDVWKLVAEPYHLPDWWPTYNGVHPDRRGLAENARWRVTYGARPGWLLRRPGGEGTIVISRVVEGLELGWHDVGAGIDAGIELRTAGSERTTATAYVDGPWWRLVAEGARPVPRRAVARLYDLCQTAATI